LSYFAYAVESESIEVGITTHLGDQHSFTRGDRISFFLSLDQKAFVYLFYRDADANLVQLLPNQHLTNHAYEAGVFMPLPSSEQAFQFTVQAPFGDEQLIVFASSKGDFQFPGKLLENGLILLDVGIENFSETIKNASPVYGKSELRIKTLSDTN
jgi:hypothetical protein